MATASANPATAATRIPSSDLLGGYEEVAPEQAPVVVERARDLVRRRQDQRIGSAEVDVQLPRAEQRQQDQRRAPDEGERAPHPETPKASSARSLTATTAGSVRRRGSGEVDLDVRHRPSRSGRHHDHPVAEHDRFLDVVRDEHDRARLEREHVREPRLHLRPGDRVQCGKRLVQRQHRLARQQ